MVRYRQNQRRLGLISGGLAFVAGWAIVALMAPSGVFEVPRWQNTLWIYLGTHFIALATNRVGFVGTESIQPVEVAGLPDFVHLVPILTVAFAGAYVCTQIHSIRLKHNISNALAAATSYFLTALVAMVISDIQPALTVVLTIALVLGAGLWLGSTLIGTIGQGMPFFGIASVGTVLTIGVLVILGGVAVLSIIQGLVVLAFVPAIVVGALFGGSRRLERRGRRSDYPRIAGLRDILEKSWKEIAVVSIIVVALVIGITGGL